MSDASIWDLEIGTEIVIRTPTPYPKAILAQTMTNGSEPTLVRHVDITDIVYASTLVMACVPDGTRFLFVRHINETRYIIEGSAQHSGHVFLGVDGPIVGPYVDLFSLICKRAVEYERMQIRIADEIVSQARKRAREIIADAETVVDDPTPFRAVVTKR